MHRSKVRYGTTTAGSRRSYIPARAGFSAAVTARMAIAMATGIARRRACAGATERPRRENKKKQHNA